MEYGFIPQIEKLIFSPLCLTCEGAKGGGESFCFRCKKSFMRLILANSDKALFEYKDEIKKLLALFREGGTQRTLAFFLEILERKKIIQKWREQRFNCIVTAPQNPKSRKSGLQQLGEALAKELNIPYEPHVLRKQKHTQHQKSLINRMDARCFVQFHRAKSYTRAKILLLDDVFTTGTTLEMSSYQLRKNGALNVQSFTLAMQVMKSFEGEEQKAQQEGYNIEPLLAHLFV